MVVMRTSGGLAVRRPTESNIQAVLESLPRNAHVILENDNESGPETHYVQAWLRPNGVFQLEYRAGHPGEHYKTYTVSREKVCEALSGWSRGETAWQSEFTWKSIGEWFAQEEST
jgi:hypothetical protein